METHENIRALREKLGLSQEALAEKVGYKDRSSIAKIEAGLVDLQQSKIAAFAEALHVSPAVLMGFDAIIDDLPNNALPMPVFRKVPRVGRIACGTPILAEENIEDFDAVPEYIKADFTLLCRGDSMINARIFDGDIVFIKKQDYVNDGDIAAVMIGDDEATLKRVRFYDDHITLEAENPMYKPKTFWGEELNQVRIIGKATHFVSTIK